MEKIPKYETKATPYFLNRYKKWVKDKKERLPSKLKHFNIEKMQQEKMIAEKLYRQLGNKKQFPYETGREIIAFINNELEKLSLDPNILKQSSPLKIEEHYKVQKKYNEIKYHLYCALDNPKRKRDEMQERFCGIFESLYLEEEYSYNLEKTENGYELIKTKVNQNE